MEKNSFWRNVCDIWHLKGICSWSQFKENSTYSNAFTLLSLQNEMFQERSDCFPGSENSSQVLNFPEEGQELCHGGNNRSILFILVWETQMKSFRYLRAESSGWSMRQKNCHKSGGRVPACGEVCRTLVRMSCQRALTQWEAWESRWQRKPDLGKSE